MALEKLNAFTKKVQDLADKPNSTMTAAEVKAQFDAAPDEVRQYLNKAIDALQSDVNGDSGADQIGATPISTSPNTVQGILEWLKAQIDSVVLGQIPEGTVVMPLEFSEHKAEDAIHLAGGTANAITVTTPQGNYSYNQFKRLRFKAVSTSTSNVTINVDGLGTIPALKFDGTQLPVGAIKAGRIYDFYYDEANGGRFFLIAKASGTAVAGDVLAGKPFSNDDGEQIGAMPNIGNVGTQLLTSQNQIYTIPKGFHEGTGRVQATYQAGKRFQVGTAMSDGSRKFDVTGLAFKPAAVFFDVQTAVGFGAVFNTRAIMGPFPTTNTDYAGYYQNSSGNPVKQSTVYLSGNSLMSIDCGWPNREVNWVAYGE